MWTQLNQRARGRANSFRQGLIEARHSHELSRFQSGIKKARFELRPAPKANVRSIVKKTLKTRVRNDSVYKSRALLVGSRLVKRAALVTLGRTAFETVLLPVKQHYFGNSIPSELRLRGWRELPFLLPQAVICPVYLKHGFFIRTIVSVSCHEDGTAPAPNRSTGAPQSFVGIRVMIVAKRRRIAIHRIQNDSERLGLNLLEHLDALLHRFAFCRAAASH